MLYFENFDLDNVVTPVNAQVLRHLLQRSNYNPQKTEFLYRGFTEGFDIGYEGPSDVKLVSENLKLRGLGTKTTLWNKVMKEVKAKRYAGPFTEIPFDNYIQSPIGLVPKDQGKDVRLIFHLSHPRNRGTSLNANTPKHKCSVHYPDFTKAIELCLQAGKSCKMSKSDMKSAFRNLGLSKLSWRYLIMKCESPIDGKIYYFVNKCLPFGAAISCALFQGFSDAIAHIVKTITKKENINYLDDFMFVALLKALCNAQLDVFLDVCKQINFPISIEKTFWGTTQMTFLGLLIDAAAQTVSIPVEKVEKARNLLTTVLNKPSKKITVKHLQQICGFLNFIGRCIVPGRAFTRRLYSYTSGATNLRDHHHIRINSEMRADLTTWLTFVNHKAIFSRHFIDMQKMYNAEEILMYSDASRSEILGFGGICDESWMFGQWPENYIKQYEPSIEYLELYALLATVLNWIHRFKDKRIILFCDNQSVVQMVNNTTSSCKNCMVLIRILVLKSMIENVRIFAKFVPSKSNTAADLLSRLKIEKFKKLKIWEEYPMEIPEQIWPIQKLWVN